MGLTYRRDQIRRALQARSIASGRFSRLWITLVAVMLGLKPNGSSAAWIVLPVRVPTGRWMWLADISELRVICEIFVDRIYDDPCLPAAPRIILDLGANAGAASEFFASRYPNSEIVAYEADPQVAKRASSNLKGRPGVQVHCAAVSVDNAPVTIHRVAGQSWGTSAYGVGGEVVTVPGISLDEIVGDRRIDVLKIDIEGSEYAAFKAATRLDQIDLILGEFHPSDDVTAEDFFSLFDGFELIHGGGSERGTFTARRRPDPARVA